jgi:hypothetical protein
MLNDINSESELNKMNLKVYELFAQLDLNMDKSMALSAANQSLLQESLLDITNDSHFNIMILNDMLLKQIRKTQISLLKLDGYVCTNILNGV